MDTSFFSVLSEPNRLGIVELLYTSPHSVNEIAQRLKLNQPQTSKHLKVLADAGIVHVQPLAQQRFYTLRPERFKELDTWIAKYRNLWGGRFDRLDKFLSHEVKKK